METPAWLESLIETTATCSESQAPPFKMGYRSVHHHLDGPEVLIEGIYQGHEVVLRMLAEAPEDEEPGMLLDVGETPAAIDVN